MAGLMRREGLEMLEPLRRLLEGDVEATWPRVEEYRDGNTVVIRADLPGIDPDQDVELTVADDVLHLEAERRERTEHKDKGSYRSEFRYGSFSRALPLPPGCRDEDISASYRDGVLEVRVPVVDHADPPATRKIQVTRG